jgi:phospholipid/cholesterol/gamma-HCH transport system substrate-binding protein
MYASKTTQVLVGIFAALGIAALAFLSLRLGKVELFIPPSYLIYANFDNVAGLKNGADIEIAGVEVGKVMDIALNDERARVTMRLDKGIKIDEDAVAAVRTRGIIGDKYIAISPGPGEKNVPDGGTLRQTESSFVLEDAIGQLISSPSTANKDKNQTQNEGKGNSDSGDLGLGPPKTSPSSSPASPKPSPSSK